MVMERTDKQMSFSSTIKNIHKPVQLTVLSWNTDEIKGNLSYNIPDHITEGYQLAC